MKKLLIPLILLSLISLIISPVSARESLRGLSDPTKLQELGAKMIDRRTATIARYDGFLLKTKYISEAVLAQVRQELSRVNQELSDLKIKIMAETDPAVLKADIKSIVNYRVYQVFLPQSAGLVATDRLKTFASKLGELKTKISQKADELEGQGKDVTEIRNLLSSADGKLQDADGFISTAEQKFSAMTIADPEGSRTLRLDGRSALVSARQNFSEARKNLKDAVLKIKELVK